MRTPIAYTLGWPERIATTGERLELGKNINLAFEPIDIERFIAIKLARQALQAGLGYPTVLNAANEIAVAAFLDRKLPFSAIESVAEQTLQKVKISSISSLNEIFQLDVEARAIAAGALAALQ